MTIWAGNLRYRKVNVCIAHTSHRIAWKPTANILTYTKHYTNTPFDLTALCFGVSRSGVTIGCTNDVSLTWTGPPRWLGGLRLSGLTLGITGSIELLMVSPWFFGFLGLSFLLISIELIDPQFCVCDGTNWRSIHSGVLCVMVILSGKVIGDVTNYSFLCFRF